MAKKGYLVSAYRSIKDPDKLAAYAKLAGPAFSKYGAKYLARGDAAQAYEAGIKQRIVIVEFESVAKAVRSDPRAPLSLVPVPVEATSPDVEHAVVAPFTLMDNPSGRWHEADLGQTVVYGVDVARRPEGDRDLRRRLDPLRLGCSP